MMIEALTGMSHTRSAERQLGYSESIASDAVTETMSTNRRKERTYCTELEETTL